MFERNHCEERERERKNGRGTNSLASGTKSIDGTKPVVDRIYVLKLIKRMYHQVSTIRTLTRFNKCALRAQPSHL